MPNYLTQLSKDNMKETEDTAHKIKGAAASVGLNHLRQLADTLESAAKNSDVFFIVLKIYFKNYLIPIYPQRENFLYMQSNSKKTPIKA